MLYFVIDTISFQGEVKAYLATHNHQKAVENAAAIEGFVVDRNSLKSRLDASVLASACNKAAGENLYTWVDYGSNVSPRYDVVQVPRVGDEVSYAFNGDSYPCGKVTKVSHFKAYGGGVSCRRVEAQEGEGDQLRTHIFWRLGDTASWRKDKTWSLVQGHHYKQNPSF